MNFITDYLDYASEITDAPLEFHQFVSYGILASVIGNKLFFAFGDTKIYPNLWLILLAPSSAYRKTTSMSIGKRILSQVEPAAILPNEFSTEKLIETLAARPCGTFFFSEFMSLMGLMARDYMQGAKSFLTDIYDCPMTYTRELKGKQFKIVDPCISLISATTQTWFVEKLKESDIGGGFLPRFLIVPSNRKLKDMPLPPMADKDKQKTLTNHLKTLSSYSGQMVFSEDAKRVYLQWYQQQKGVELNSFSAFAYRLQTYFIKIAMILQCSHVPLKRIIDEGTANETKIVINWLLNSLKVVESGEMAFNRYQENDLKVTKLLQRRGKLSRADVLMGTRLASRELNESMQTLTENGTLTITHERPDGGGKAIQFWTLNTLKA